MGARRVYDTDGDGCVTQEEFVRLYRERLYPLMKASDLHKEYDANATVQHGLPFPLWQAYEVAAKKQIASPESAGKLAAAMVTAEGGDHTEAGKAAAEAALNAGASAEDAAVIAGAAAGGAVVQTGGDRGDARIAASVAARDAGGSAKAVDAASLRVGSEASMEPGEFSQGIHPSREEGSARAEPGEERKEETPVLQRNRDEEPLGRDVKPLDHIAAAEAASIPSPRLLALTCATTPPRPPPAP